MGSRTAPMGCVECFMKYLIIGHGYLGRQFKEYFRDSVMSEVRIEGSDDVRGEIEKYEPTWIFNCAGITGRPNIDWCEDHKHETFTGNALLPITIAMVCKDMGVKMMHLGSGCVYSGDNNGKGWSEEDSPNFAGSFYSKTKALSEDMLKDYDVLQLRLRMPIDSDISKERNFVRKITNYDKIINIKNSMTIAEDLLKAAEVLINKKRTGLYNIVNPGPMSHSKILDLYKEIVDPSFTYEIISIEELHKMTKAKRSNCVLNGDKLARDIELPSLRERIIEIFNNYKK